MPAPPLPNNHYELMDALPDWAWMARDRRTTVRLIAARDALAGAEQELRDAVREAFDGGSSWLTIGTILGISRQAAQRRFRRPPEESESEEGE
jgi:hypothetical protein